MQETQETWVWFLGWADPPEEEMATHSSILAWKIPSTEEPGRDYSPWGHKESDTTEHACALVIQWLRLCASTAGDAGLIPGLGIKNPHTV